MAKPRVLVKRRKSVRNIRKITRTMQLIATARFQAAFNRSTAAKPYTQKLAELVAALSTAAQEVRHPLMQPRGEVKRSALVVITSNRGLCGGYNAHLLRAATGHLEALTASGMETDVLMVGKKGMAFFRFLRRSMAQCVTNIGDSPRFAQIEPIANSLMDRFTRGELASAYVAYTKFFSLGKQHPVVMELLPLAPGAGAEPGEPPSTVPAAFEFSPEPQALLHELLPAAVRARVFECFTDAAVSEQFSRMVAMRAATDAAEDMITTLTRQYNRARQTQITMELLDIVGGANALA